MRKSTLLTRSRAIVGVLAALALVTGGIAISVPAAADDGLPSFTTTPTPTLSETPVAGGTETVIPGAYVPTPDSLSYQWYLDGAPVGGGAAQYVVPSNGMGKQLTVSVTANLAGHEPVTLTSEPVVVLGVIGVGLVSITGLPIPGNTLGISTSDWTPADVSLAYQWIEDSQPIDGATDSTYTVRGDDSGHVLGVLVTASKVGYNDRQGGTNYLTVDYDHVITSTEYIGGEESSGSTVTATVPAWLPEPTSFTYQWQSDGVEIPGATSKTYLVQDSDIGHVLTFVVSGAPAGFSETSAVSLPSRTIPTAFDSDPTVITGTAQLGVPLHVDVSNWTPAPDSVTFVWSVGGQTVSSDTNDPTTFTPTDPTTMGETVTVTVTAEDGGRGVTSVTSAPTAPIAEGSVNVATIKLGSVRLNVPIVPKVPTVPAGAPLTVTWRENGVPVAGATGKTFTPEEADYGKKISVEYTIAGPGWITSTGTSNSEKPLEGYVKYEGVFITGVPRVGEVLTMHAAWGPSGTKVSYHWFDSKDFGLSHSNAMTYTVRAADLGHTVFGMSEGSQAHFHSSAWIGGPGVKISSGQFSAAPTVTVTGTTAAGGILTATHTAAVPSTGVSYKYQWYSQVVAGAPLVKISKATSSRYTVNSKLAGDVISVIVTASKSGYTSVTGSSISPLVVTSSLRAL